ncbi:beta-galactosidase [Candidatus Latescibacterota bacterium]
MNEILYGVAYYYEYMPYERLERDAQMMKECGINVVRICESTWSYMEPQDGVFNLDYVGRILDVMHEHGIKVIVGTPTYAIPPWLARKYPEILVTTKDGQRPYGSRQNMDITNKDYRFHAERIIRKLIEYVHDHPAVIGYQVDNETKHYGTAGDNVQKLFVEYLRNKFVTTDAMNMAFGLHYWSNSIAEWDDMPSTVGTINGSLGSEFSKFQRAQVTEFLAWQVSILNEYKKPGQFVTQNFDLSWRNGSYVIQPDVDHFEAAVPLDVAGDVYHRTQDQLDGVTIALAGDIARSIKRDNYFVIETQAQSILNSVNQKLPYPGQLRQQAFSHIASGANMVAYWHWHSIHNSIESYWKGLLSHDLEPNPTFFEAQQIASEFKKISSQIVSLKKHNKVAIYFSNEALTALEWFQISNRLNYNDVLRRLFETCYKLNVECDFIDHTSDSFDQYDVILVPPLYSASDSELERLTAFAKNGGHVLFSFKSGFTNEHVQVRPVIMPGTIREACGVSYQQFTSIGNVPLRDNPFNVEPPENYISDWAELLVPESAETLAWYDHPYWGKYAAITQNIYGKGTVLYLGGMPSNAILEKLLLNLFKRAGIISGRVEIRFPLIVRQGINRSGETVRFLFNYSNDAHTVDYPYDTGEELLSGKTIKHGTTIEIEPWGVRIIKE